MNKLLVYGVIGLLIVGIIAGVVSLQAWLLSWGSTLVASAFHTPVLDFYQSLGVVLALGVISGILRGIIHVGGKS